MALNEWYYLARLAELVERGEAKLERHFGSGGYADGLFVSQLTVRHPEIESGISDEEQGQLCEMLSGRFMERAIALGVTGEKKKDCLSEQNCITCLALPGDWCRPTHPGERDAGGWLHPERENRSNVIGPLRDGKHITSAMARFHSMKFSSKNAKGIAFAQILHAGLKFGLEMGSWAANNPALTWERYPSYLPYQATGEELDVLASTSYGILRMPEETDRAFRLRLVAGLYNGQLNLTTFRVPPDAVLDQSWVGKHVTILDSFTVDLVENHPGFQPHGVVSSVLLTSSINAQNRTVNVYMNR